MSTQRRLRAVPEAGHRLVLYVRVSAVMGREAEDFHSPAMQTKAIRDLAARRGLLEVAVVEDIDVSGRTFQRDGIQRVMAMARAREIDVVGLYDLSRLGRNTAESLRTIAELRELGVTVVSTVEQIDDTPEGQFQLGVFLGMAQLYSDQISRRWRQVIEHRLEQGLFHGSVPPMGYVREGRLIVPDPVLAPAVREVFRRYAAGERIWHIARDWRASTGRHSQYVTLKRMLANPVYVGQVTVNGRVVDGQHEALVSPAMWRKVQRRLAEDARTPSRRLAIANPLAGLAVCDECSRPLQLHYDAKRLAGGGEVLQCRGARELRDCRGPGSPTIPEVEAAVLDAIDRELERVTVDMGAARAVRKARHAEATADAGRIRRELVKVDAALGRLAADLARRDITADEHRTAAALLRDEQESLRERLSKVERVQSTPPTDALVKVGRSLRRRWPRMHADEKNAALRHWVAQIRVARAVSYRQPVSERVEVLFL